MLSRLTLILEKLLLLNLAFLYVDKEQNAKIPDHTQCEEKVERSRGVVVRGSDNGPGNEGAYERCCADDSEGEEENFFPSERELRQLPEPEISRVPWRGLGVVPLCLNSCRADLRRDPNRPERTKIPKVYEIQISECNFRSYPTLSTRWSKLQWR